MYSPDKMMSGKPLHPPISASNGCFSGRYSPTYRSPDPMRRCMPNPSSRILEETSLMCNSWTTPRHNGERENKRQSRKRQKSRRTNENAFTEGPLQSMLQSRHEQKGKPNAWRGAFNPPESFLPAKHRTVHPARLDVSSILHTGDLFGGLNDGLLTRAEALAAVDMGKHPVSTTPGLPQLKHDMMYHHGMGTHPGTPNSRTHQMGHHGMDGLEMLDPISTTSMTTLTPMSDASGGGHHQIHSSMYGPGMNMMSGHHHHHGGTLGNPTGHHGGHHHPAHAHHSAMAAAAAAAAAAGLHPDADTDPRELEAFAERFKQRRIKLGVTQADVGKALANLKLPGVGALSQSTICRFESLTLSHNNMIALKPILQAWLEEAEAQAKNKRRDPDAPSVLPAGEKKRKRTSIAAPEKRSLEAYFAVQPRPSGEKIAAIAEKLDLKKNVVRVWFCNQRQKQKRMKFAAQH